MNGTLDRDPQGQVLGLSTLIKYFINTFYGGSDGMLNIFANELNLKQFQMMSPNPGIISWEDNWLDRSEI